MRFLVRPGAQQPQAANQGASWIKRAPRIPRVTLLVACCLLPTACGFKTGCAFPKDEGEAWQERVWGKDVPRDDPYLAYTACNIEQEQAAVDRDADAMGKSNVTCFMLGTTDAWQPGSGVSSKQLGPTRGMDQKDGRSVVRCDAMRCHAACMQCMSCGLGCRCPPVARRRGRGPFGEQRSAET